MSETNLPEGIPKAKKKTEEISQISKITPNLWKNKSNYMNFNLII